MGRDVISAGHTRSVLPIGSPLTDADDHKLSGLHGRNANQTNQATLIKIVLRHRRPVAFDKECLLSFAAQKHSLSPEIREKVAHALCYLRPQAFIVGFKHRPLSAFSYRVFQKDEESPNVYVLPFWI